MKKEELKQIIKPLIKECLKEVLVEEGFAKMLSETKQSLPVQEIKKPVQQNVNIKSTALLEATDGVNSVIIKSAISWEILYFWRNFSTNCVYRRIN